MLSLKQLQDMPPHTVFATGTTSDDAAGINMANTGAQLRWVAKRGQIHDWAIYIHSGQNVFLTGEPGAGKTYTLNKFIEEAQLKHKRIAITASTGIAASHIGGTTIHSWSGLGIADQISDAELDRMGYKMQLVERYSRCDILIIDEISMLHGSRLDMVDRACRWIRRKEEVPFGGLQVIFVGDMFQLPPVTRGSDETDFAHHSNAWRVAELKPAYLTEQHRQGAGDELLDILREMRRDGKVSAEAKRVLDTRVAYEESALP